MSKTSSTRSSITTINFFLHFPPIATNPGLWNKICKKLEVQIDNVLKKHQDILSKSLKDYQTSGPWVIQEISRLAPEAVVSNLTKMLIETINSGKTFLVTNSKTLFFPSMHIKKPRFITTFFQFFQF